MHGTAPRVWMLRVCDAWRAVMCCRCVVFELLWWQLTHCRRCVAGLVLTVYQQMRRRAPLFPQSEIQWSALVAAWLLRLWLRWGQV
jgi:hypothetical protein